MKLSTILAVTAVAKAQGKPETLIEHVPKKPISEPPATIWANRGRNVSLFSNGENTDQAADQFITVVLL